MPTTTPAIYTTIATLVIIIPSFFLFLIYEELKNKKNKKLKKKIFERVFFYTSYTELIPIPMKLLLFLFYSLYYMSIKYSGLGAVSTAGSQDTSCEIYWGVVKKIMCWKEMDKMLIKNTKRMDGKKGVEIRKKA